MEHVGERPKALLKEANSLDCNARSCSPSLVMDSYASEILVVLCISGIISVKNKKWRNVIYWFVMFYFAEFEKHSLTVCPRTS